MAEAEGLLLEFAQQLTRAQFPCGSRARPTVVAGNRRACRAAAFGARAGERPGAIRRPQSEVVARAKLRAQQANCCRRQPMGPRACSLGPLRAARATNARDTGPTKRRVAQPRVAPLTQTGRSRAFRRTLSGRANWPTGDWRLATGPN